MVLGDIQTRIREIAAKMPEKEAIEHGGRITTYGQLEENSNIIASFLSKKLGNNKNVIVMLDRSTELIEALFGIIKAGGVFVPVDPAFPEDRQALMTGIVQTDTIITCSKYFEKILKMNSTFEKCFNVLVFGSIKESTGSSGTLNIETFEGIKSQGYTAYEKNDNKHCYIYFTSGSTGVPKAILGRQRSLLHFIDWETREFGVDSSFRVSQLTSPSFDPFLRDVFIPLLNGGTLCIPENSGVIIDPAKLVGFITRSRINLVHMVPSIFKLISGYITTKDTMESLRFIMLAGEMLRGNDIKKFIELYNGRVQLVNLYGPTETTLAKLFYRVQKGDEKKDRIPVGKPIDSTEAIILSTDMKRCRMGEIGEVYIRTPFITSGYYNSKELTSKVFMKNPFSQNPADIIYKTGDLAFLHQDGNIEVIGRADNQVKIRGIRMELGEIENKVLSYSGIKEAIVLDKEDKTGTRFLCCYFTPDTGFQLSGLYEYLKGVLPDYMLPAQFVEVDKIPLTPNGKVDRNKLAAVEGAVKIDNASYVAPSTDIERSIAGIWEELLEVKGIGIKDNFFKNGGNSILLVQMHSKLEALYPGQINIMDLYKNPTIEFVAKSITTRPESKNKYNEFKKIKIPYEYLSLTHTKHTMFQEEHRIKADLAENIKEVCREEELNMHDFMLSMFIFLLGDFSKLKEFQLCFNSGNSGFLKLLDVNLADINDFSSLFENVKGLMVIDKNIDIDDLASLKPSLKVDEMLVCMGSNDQNSYIIDCFDLTLNIADDSDGIMLCFKYDQSKLKNDKMKEFIQKYLGLINNFTYQYVKE